MPARDIFHYAVKRALIKDAWVITADPLSIKLLDSDINIYVDLAAEQLIAAEKASRKIAVEVKSFIGTSFITDFHEALGQLLNYRLALRDQEPGRELYLAVSLDVYQAFFTRRFVVTVCQEYVLNLIVFDPGEEVICLWSKK